MDQKFALKYRRILEIISDTAGCAENKLILVGGTALALFYLKHRASVDLDFVPVDGDENKLKETIYEMKLEAYANRKAVRDLFDIVFILRHTGKDYGPVKELLTRYGSPNDLEEMGDYILSEKDYEFFNEVVKNAS